YNTFFFFFSSRRRHTRLQGDWSSDVCSSDLATTVDEAVRRITEAGPDGMVVAGLGDAPDGFIHGCGAQVSKGRQAQHQRLPASRSEERRVGKECRSQQERKG